MITSIKASNAGTLVGVAGMPPGNVLQSAFGSDYQLGQPGWRVTAAHSRTAEAVRRGSAGSGVHPFDPGYGQIADYWWAWEKAMAA